MNREIADPPPPHPIARYPIRNIPMEMPSLLWDSLSLYSELALFRLFLDDGDTFCHLASLSLINDGWRMQIYLQKCRKSKIFDSEISWNRPKAILFEQGILIRDTLCNFMFQLMYGVTKHAVVAATEAASSELIWIPIIVCGVFCHFKIPFGRFLMNYQIFPQRSVPRPFFWFDQWFFKKNTGQMTRLW